MNHWDILIIVIVAAALFAAVRSVIKKRKSCGCGCEGCSGCGKR